MTIAALVIALTGWGCYLATPDLGLAVTRLGLCELMAICVLRLKMEARRG